MTLYVPEGIRARGAGAVYFAPAVANMAAPSVAEFSVTGAFAAHCNTENWGWRGEQNTEAKKLYCLAQNVQAFGDVSFTIDPMTVICDPQNPDHPDYTVYENVVTGSSWYALDRRGLLASVPLAVGQIVDVLPVSVGYVSHVDINDEEGALIRVTIPLIITSPPSRGVALVA